MQGRVGDLSWWWVKWIGDGSLSHDVLFQKKGWLGAVWSLQTQGAGQRIQLI